MNLNYKKFLLDARNVTSAPVTINASQALKDIELLSEALEKAYPAKWAMDLQLWQNIIFKLKSLKLTKTISTEAFGAELADILWQIPDGHLKVRINEKVLGGEFKHHLRKPTTGANLANLAAEEFWKIDYRKSSIGLIPIIAISGFPQASEPQWNGFSDAIKKTLTAAAIIVDLRGNSGGDDTRAHEMASVFLGRNLETDWVREVICETAEAIALQINTYEMIIWRTYSSKNVVPPEELTQKLQSLKDKAEALSFEPLDNCKVINQELLQDAKSEAPLAFKKKIFVLIDPCTVSSGEWAALYLKKHPNTVLVGENTYGMIHFGNTGNLRLPHSGLNISLCMKINEITDGRFFEKKGILPDILISNTDSLNYVLNQLT